MAREPEPAKKSRLSRASSAYPDGTDVLPRSSKGLAVKSSSAVLGCYAVELEAIQRIMALFCPCRLFDADMMMQLLGTDNDTTLHPEFVKPLNMEYKARH